MSKNNEPQTQQPPFVKELLENCTVTLTALSRDEFDAMLKDIPADVKYGAGAVGRDRESGVFSLRLDIVKP